MQDVRDVIALLEPRAPRLVQRLPHRQRLAAVPSLDSFVTSRRVRLVGQRAGWKRRTFFVRDWSHTRFVAEFGLFKLLGTIRYPGGTHAT